MDLKPSTQSMLCDEAYVHFCSAKLEQVLAQHEKVTAALAQHRPAFGLLATRQRREAYAHHIQRLMVTGLFALLLGVRPQAVHAWYLAVYVDAVEWVELPNTLGMSQFGDGGLMASKPYVASGKYIQRMGNHCKSCRYEICGLYHQTPRWLLYVRFQSQRL